jgi:hypothetical protein
MSKKDRPDYSKMSVNKRLGLAEKIYIGYPRLDEMLKKIEHCHQHSKLAAEPECLLITGETGAGKTTLYKRYERRYPRYEDEGGVMIPVLSTTIPVPATVKSLATRLLIAMGDPMAEMGTVVAKSIRLQRLIEECNVELIIIDEFQHFIDRDSSKVLQTVSDWLKDLLNGTRKPIVLIGMPNSVEVLHSNRQLNRRFAVRDSLESFGWATSQEKKDFRKFLNALDDMIPLMERSNLADPNIAYPIYCATEGNVANVMTLIRRAVAVALESLMEKLTLEVLAQAYEQRLAAKHLATQNPFLD